MDVQKQIEQFREFFDEYYRAEILRLSSTSDKFIICDFSDLSKFDVELANELLETPEELVKAAEIAIADFIDSEKFRVRFKNIPESKKVGIRNIRADHIGTFSYIEGLVRQKTDVRPQMTSAKFECPSCGNIINVIQIEKTRREPTTCGCGRKGKFIEIDKELVDMQGIVLEEIPETLEGGEQPKRINILLKEDLVSPITDKKTNPGAKVKVMGIVKEIPIINQGAKTTRYDLVVEANYITPADESVYEIKISPEEEEEFQEIAKDPKIYEKLVAAMAPTIYGYNRVKEALLYQLVGGVRKVRYDGIASRGDVHILLVGDPGAGKSQLLKRLNVIAPKARYVAGKGVSGAGLTAAVVRDEILGGWSLEAGALVLANNGMVCVDEMDKMTVEDRSAMHEAMEQQTVSISKANIQATLLSRTTILAAANPKFGRFDPYGIVAEQIDLPPTLINRFDLIFPIQDLPDKTRDDKMASHILNLHKTPGDEDEFMPTEKLTKYVSYSRQNAKPQLTEEALEEIKRYYVQMRNSGTSDEKSARAVPISARQLEALIRLSEASAKVRLAKEVTKTDARRAIDLLTYCLLQVGFDRETGTIDIDRISSGISASKRDKIYHVKEILSSLEKKLGKTIPIDDVLKEASEKGISESEAEEIIEKLKRSGDIYEPRLGFLSRV